MNKTYCSPIFIALLLSAFQLSSGANGASAPATPTLSPGAGTYVYAQPVVIKSTTPGTTLYWTLDGSTPTTRSTPYTSPVWVTYPETLKAIAVSSDGTSGVVSATYNFEDQPPVQTPAPTQAATPSFSPAAGNYGYVQHVSISDTTAGAAIYWTLDGSTPTTSSTKYTSPIWITSAHTLKAVAIASNTTASSVASGTYTIGGTTTVPVPVAAAVKSNATVTVNPGQLGPATTNKILGMNMAYWYDPSQAAIIPAFQSAGIQVLRWPGGSGSDFYHWQSNSLCKYDYLAPNSDFNDVSRYLFNAGGFDVSITANYGTNASCNGPGDPSEAAAWVAQAQTLGVNVSHWTIGNESFGYWEEDLHSAQHDPATYANAVATGYYPQMKAANPNIEVGVVVDAGYSNPQWDPTVLSQAKYDFVEYHYYPEDPWAESDNYLVTQAAQQLTTDINIIKSQLASAGHANTPIYLGEIGADNTNPGKQTTSITQALYAGQVLGELMNAGVARASWWLGFGGCSDATAGNFATSLYGWQDFGGYMVFADGLPAAGCPNSYYLPAGTMLPTARAYQLFSSVALNGEHALTAGVSGDTGNIRAYAASNNGGTALVLFNLNQFSSETVSVTLSGQTSAAAVTVQTYDKAAYDQSQNKVWAGPTTTNLGGQSLPMTLTLTPWSMNVVMIH